MIRLKKIGLTGLIVLIQVLVVCWIVDFAFKKYEAKHLYQYATKDAAAYDLNDFLYHDLGNHITKRKPDGELRILVLGDSFTFAVTSPRLSFCNVLQQRLSALGLWKSVRVVNLGFPSISFPRYLELFHFWSQALDYDAVIFNVYLGNDFNDVRRDPYDPAAFREILDAACAQGLPYGPNTLVPHKYPFRFLDFLKAKAMDTIITHPALRHLFGMPDLPPATPAAVSCRTAPGAAQRIATSAWWPAARPALAATAAPAPEAPAGFNPADYSSLLPLTKEEMASEMRSSIKPFVRETLLAYPHNLPWYRLFLATAAKVAATGKPVLVMLSPPLCAVSPEVGSQAARDLGVTPGQVDRTLPRHLTLELARAVGLPFDDIVDLTPCLRERTPSGALTYTGLETHWSVAGNAWVADILADAIQRRWLHHNLPSPAACPPPGNAEFAGQPLLAPQDLTVDAATQALADRIVAGCSAPKP